MNFSCSNCAAWRNGSITVVASPGSQFPYDNRVIISTESWARVIARAADIVLLSVPIIGRVPSRNIVTPTSPIESPFLPVQKLQPSPYPLGKDSWLHRRYSCSHHRRQNPAGSMLGQILEQLFDFYFAKREEWGETV